MTEAFHQHLKELIKIFKHIEPNKGKLNAKVRLMLEKAYCLQNRANGVPFVPATRGEWNLLYFNPDLLEEKFIEHKQQVYVAQRSFIDNKLIEQNLLELNKRLEKKLILRNENIEKLVKNSPSLGLQPRTPESERQQNLRKQLQEKNRIYLNKILEKGNTPKQNQKRNIVSKTEKTEKQLILPPQLINRKLIFENNEDFNLNLKKWTEENNNNLQKQEEALRKDIEKDEKRKGGK